MTDGRIAPLPKRFPRAMSPGGSLRGELPQPSGSGLRHAEHEHRVAQREVELEVAPCGYGDELLAVHGEHGRGGVDTGAALELPQHLAGLGVVRLEPAVALAREDEATCRRGPAFCPVARSSAGTVPHCPSPGIATKALPSHNRAFS